MKIAITGSTGFVGKNLINYINKSVELILINKEQLNAATFVLDQVDSVVHLAAKAHDLKSTSNPDEFYQINYELTKKIYDSFLLSNAKKFIFISSVKAVADHADNPLTENFIPDPKTSYGKSKLLAEEYIRMQPLPTGKKYYILRPCMIHGPGNKGNLNLLYKFISYGVPYPLSAFENKRSFLSVENLCFVIKEILDRDDLPTNIYNIADDEALSTSEIVSLISKSVSKSPRLFAIPKGLVFFLARIGDVLKLPLNTDRLGKLTENFLVSNERIKNIIEKDLPLSSRQGIVKALSSFKNEQETHIDCSPNSSQLQIPEVHSKVQNINLNL